MDIYTFFFLVTVVVIAIVCICRSLNKEDDKKGNLKSKSEDNLFPNPKVTPDDWMINAYQFAFKNKPHCNYEIFSKDIGKQYPYEGTTGYADEIILKQKSTGSLIICRKVYGGLFKAEYFLGLIPYGPAGYSFVGNSQWVSKKYNSYIVDDDTNLYEIISVPSMLQRMREIYR